MKTPRKRIIVTVYGPQADFIKAMAARLDVSSAEVMRRALDAFIEMSKKRK